ncbi:UNVERIFIED_CONTAM: hypothetical protein GTU68_050212 [Idotea baltica]|nr:hypothetical protein [Idotea baltica]
MTQNPLIVPVELGPRSYDILVGAGALSHLPERLSKLLQRSRVFVLTDETVAGLHLETLEQLMEANGIAVERYVVPPGEATKSMSQLEALLDWLMAAGADRSDVLIAFGGGVVGDLAGLAASLMKRGMGLVQVPTTLLAQVDSSVGGKTAVNSARGKNLIGSFYQPQLVLADSALLKTLPERQIRAGYAEIIKYGLINDAPFFAWLDEYGADVRALEPAAIAEAVARSCAAKASIVAQDEREGGVRALLNLGHTFGHALEAANNYGPELLHGEAVACGMVLALEYSQRLGLMETSDVAHARKHLAAAGFDIDISALNGGPYPATGLVDAMRQDKKVRGGQVPLILAKGIGRSFIHPNADLADVQEFLSVQTRQS